MASGGDGDAEGLAGGVAGLGDVEGVVAGVPRLGEEEVRLPALGQGTRGPMLLRFGCTSRQRFTEEIGSTDPGRPRLREPTRSS